jgi:3'-phosphoadenosine 5'-phosphosulfate sulfotransferase (PAPS reductase)/FAD synthetase
MIKIIVPVSGGKDSQATLILAMQDGREVIPVFNDTGWDHPQTYEHLQYMVGFFGLELNVTHYDEAPTMEELIRARGRFPFGLGRFCTSEFKRTAFKRWLDTMPGQFEQWLGIRSDESGQRKKKYKGMEATDFFSLDDIAPKKFPKRIKDRVDVCLPLINHTREEVFSIIKDAGMKYNPLYDQGFDRVGCFPCLIAGKKIQKKAFETPFGQLQWKKINSLEKELGIKYEYYEEASACMMCEI